jgi:hypothetical protein
MPVVDANTSGEAPSSDISLVRQHRYVAPSLSRYGTLADLTRHTGTTNANDGGGTGCGNKNHGTSCLNPSDIQLKHDIVLLGRLNNGLGFYRFSYNGSHTAYVGVMAQEVQAVMPEAVQRGSDGYLRVFYGKLGLKFQTYDEWVASGARIAATTSVAH